MVIDDDLSLRVVIHGVDGEIAPRRIFFHRPPDVVTQHAPGGINGVRHARELVLAGALVAANLLGLAAVQVRAEGGDFDHLMLAAPAINDVNNAKTPPNDEGAAKQRFDLLGRGVGGHVEIFRAQANEQIAHRAADDVSLKTGLLERAYYVHRPFIDQFRVNAVLLGTNVVALAKQRFFDSGRAWRVAGLGAGLLAVYRAAFFAKQLADEFFDHDLLKRGGTGQLCTPCRRCVPQINTAVWPSDCGSGGLKQVKYAPSPRQRHGAQALVGVGGDWPGGFFQQGQIVQRVGVERGLHIVPA